MRPVGVGAESRGPTGKRRVHEHDGDSRGAGAQDLVLGEVLRPLVVPEQVVEVDERMLRRRAAVLGDAERGDRARVHEPPHRARCTARSTFIVPPTFTS